MQRVPGHVSSVVTLDRLREDAGEEELVFGRSLLMGAPEILGEDRCLPSANRCAQRREGLREKVGQAVAHQRNQNAVWPQVPRVRKALDALDLVAGEKLAIARDDGTPRRNAEQARHLFGEMNCPPAREERLGNLKNGAELSRRSPSVERVRSQSMSQLVHAQEDHSRPTGAPADR